MYRSTRKTVFSAKYHVIWVPEVAAPGVLVGPVAERLKAIVRDVITEHDGDILGLEVMPDHVHLLVEVPPSVPLSGLLQVLKGRRSRLLRQEFPRLRAGRAVWSRSWFLSTVGGAPLNAVNRYVESQKEVE